MKRVIVSWVVGLGALLAACTQEETALPYAGLVGTYDVALVGDRVFVTSSGNNELRVLELKDDFNERQFARAPNPLEALSIPVLKRPEALTRDVRYDDEGSEVAGPYVYARSNGSTEISVVAADPSLQREVRRLSTSELSKSLPLPSTGPVTAFAARGPDESGLSTLYYATQEPTGAWLWQLRLPGPQALLEGATVAAPERLMDLPANVAVSSILTMPGSGEIAVATRGAAGVSGKSFLMNLRNSTMRELNFGAQVLQLATHPKVDYVVPNFKYRNPKNPEEILTRDDDRTLKPGERIFGILDASSCGGQPQCTGVLAVEADTGLVAKDFSGRDELGNPAFLYDMLPISGGAGLPMGLSLSRNTRLLLQSGTRSVQTLPLLGIVPLSNGQILFFDAVGLRPFDVLTATPSSTVSVITAQGVNRADPGDITVNVTEGITRNATYSLTYQGILPGMNALTRTPGTTVFELPAALWAQRGQLVKPGDLLVLTPDATGQQPCTDVVVGSVQPPATAGASAFLVPAGDIPAGCVGYTRFQVRAAGSQPLIISEVNGEYAARLGLSESVTRTNSYYFHPQGYQGQTEGIDVRFTASNRLYADIARDDRYVVNTVSNYFPFGITVDLNVPALQAFRLPGPVVQANVGGTSYAYIAYPSADGILQVNLEAIFVDVANSNGVYPYR